jgi:hypothetical protein
MDTLIRRMTSGCIEAGYVFGFGVVSFVEDYWLFNDHSCWSAGRVILVVNLA